MQTLAFDFQRVEIARVVEEGIDRAAFEQGLEMSLQKRGEIGAEEQRIAPARPGILHGGAIADGDRAVFQFQQHRHAFAGLADFTKAGGPRRTDINEAVVLGALLDRLLVVEKK